MALDFLLLYEHVVREYESLLLLAAELRRRGYTAEIRQLLDRKKLKYFTWKKPKVLVASCLYDNEGLNSHVYNNVGRLDKVVNLHWEQMLSDTQEEEPWFNFSGNAKKCVQTCWGPATQKRLAAHGVPEKNAPVTGAIMMDFLRPQFAGYFDDKAALCARHGLNPQALLVLYISSFGYASMDEAEVAELSDMAGTDFREFARVNRESMDTTLDWFGRWLSENPGAQLVYRRHPSEWDSPRLLEMQRRYPNFHVIFEGSVKQWITAADYCLIWMSTAIAEVYFAAGNKGCTVLRPQPVPHEFDPVIYKDCAAAESYGAFCAALARVKEGEAQAAFPIPPGIIEAYFDQGEAPAYVRMADLLEDVHKNPPRDAPFGAGYTPRFNWLKCFALWGVHLLFALRLNPAPVSKFAGRIYGYVQKAHVPRKTRREMAAKIEAVLQKSGAGGARRAAHKDAAGKDENMRENATDKLGEK